MKYLSFKGLAVLALAIVPIALKLKFHKTEKPVVKGPSILVEVI